MTYEIPPVPDEQEKPWTMELSKLSIAQAERDGMPGLLVTAFVGSDAGIYCFVPIPAEELRDGRGHLTALNILAADLTNAFDSILWMWNRPDEAERDGAINPTSGMKIRAWRDRAGLK